MKNILLIIGLHFVAVSCTANFDKTQNLDSLAKQTVSDFYSWYIGEAYPISTSFYQMPGFKKLSPTSYVFDIEEYKKRLDKVDFFAAEFKQNLVDRLNDCNEEMLKFEWEYEPEPMFNIYPCNYLWGNQWVGGQGENISGYEITSVEVIGGSDAICVVSILIENEVFVKSIVNLKMGDNKEIKITDISLDWKK